MASEFAVEVTETNRKCTAPPKIARMLLFAAFLLFSNLWCPLFYTCATLFHRKRRSSLLRQVNSFLFLPFFIYKNAFYRLYEIFFLVKKLLWILFSFLVLKKSYAKFAFDGQYRPFAVNWLIIVHTKYGFYSKNLASHHQFETNFFEKEYSFFS